MSGAIVKSSSSSRGFFGRVFSKLIPGFVLTAIGSALRSFDAAASGRRTDGWYRPGTSANSANSAALGPVRNVARDLERNNPWATKAVGVIVANTVGWGIRPLIKNETIAEEWEKWAESAECDAEGHMNFYGLQDLGMQTIVVSGEALLVRRTERTSGGAPLKLSLIEPDQLDTTRHYATNARDKSNRIVQGVEIDSLGKPVAYWIYPSHPGDSLALAESVRVPAEDVAHVFFKKRPGQIRAVSWLAPSTLRLQDFDQYEDAALMRQKIAACFAGFRVNLDGSDESDNLTSTVEPGMLYKLSAGEDIRFASPPATPEAESFARGSLRGSAAGLHVTYEQLTNDYSQVNYSSARMGQLSHGAQVNRWRWRMMVPMFCDRVWSWFLDSLVLAGKISVQEAEAERRVKWAAPPLPLIDPEKDGIAAKNNIRSGLTTLEEAIAEQGVNPASHLEAIARTNERLDQLGIVLDSDPRKTTGAGQLQQTDTQSA